MLKAKNSDEHLAEAVFVSDRELLIKLACRIVESRAVAEEIVQESWLRWYGKDYNALQARPIFRRIVSNLAKDWRRSRTTETQVLSEIEAISSYAPSAERDVIARSELALVIRTLESMSNNHIRAFRMRALDGKTYKEIGRNLGVSVSQAHRLIEQVFVELVLALEP